MPEDISEDMSEETSIEMSVDMSEDISEDMSEKDVRRYVRKERQNRLLEEMPTGYWKICPKKYHKEHFYWTASIEFQVPRSLKIDVAAALLA